MPHYNSDDKLGSGVPLGGIGAGKVEIFPDGTYANFTHQNNWDSPLGPDASPGTGPGVIDARVGHHFAVWARRHVSADAGLSGGAAPGDGVPVVRLLQTADVAGLPRVERIDYEGVYPFAKLDYTDSRVPVRVRLEALSPIVPGDSRLSAMPAALFVFHVTNTDSLAASDVAIMATARNTVGSWNVGRFNRVVTGSEMAGVLFCVDSPLPCDPRAGTVCLATTRAAGKISCELAWNLKTADPFSLTLSNEDLAPWSIFAESGRLSLDLGPAPAPADHSATTSDVVGGEGIELGAALCVSATLGPGETRSIPFALAWHMPQTHFGHVYEHDYDDASLVASVALGRLDDIREGADLWESCLASGTACNPPFTPAMADMLATPAMPDQPGMSAAAGIHSSRPLLPVWLDDALRNNLYVLSSGSWWDRDGRFALFEASRTCQLMSTVDVLYYASIPVSWCYPDLQESCITQIAAAQRDDGYIPHDLGRGRIDYPSDGTTSPPRWKDLCPKFILMAYRDYLWWGGKPLLDTVYTAAKRAMLWEMGTDADDDGLPDNEGADQTFDNWSFHGANSYTSSIYLASLLACERMAHAAGDIEFAGECCRAFTRGQRSFERQLWNGRFYRAVATESTCTVGQLNGQWYAHLLGLGYILPPAHVTSSVRTMLDTNGSASEYGAVNSAFPDGRADRANSHSGNVWPGETYALAALAIYEGLVDEGLKLARKTWSNIAYRIRNPWDQPDVINSLTGQYGFGDHYMRNMGIWALAFALAKHDCRVERALCALSQSRRSSPHADLAPHAKSR